MIINNMEASTNPTAPKNSASAQEQADASDEIKTAEARVRADEQRAGRANNTSIILAIAYALLTGAIALAGLWTIRASNRLRASENLLNILQVAKVKADASKDVENARNESRERIATETARVEGEANRKIEEARGEAGEKIEDARAEAGVKIEQARAELTREQQNLAKEQQKTAILQKEAAEAILSSRRYLSQIRSLQTPRHLVKGQNREEFTQALKIQPPGAIDIIWAADMFVGEPENFAKEIAEALTEGGWTINKMQGVLLAKSEKATALHMG